MVVQTKDLKAGDELLDAYKTEGHRPHCEHPRAVAARKALADAAAKGSAAAIHNVASDEGETARKRKSNPYSDTRPSLRDAWDAAYQAAYATRAEQVGGSESA